MTTTNSSDNLKLPEAWAGKYLWCFTLGVILIAASGLVFFVGAPSKTEGLRFGMHSYLANFIYAISFGIGGMFFVLVSFLTRAGWSASIRRLAELISMTIPWVACLFAPILLVVAFSKGSALYEWNFANVEDIKESIVQAKVGYLNGPFFATRAVICLAIWSLIVGYYYRLSRKQDETGDVRLTLDRQKWSAVLMMIFALTVTMASFDWIMSIDADWFSTIFGVYLFSASMFGFFALMIVSFMVLQRNGKLKDEVNIEHYHDMGKFLFGFTMFWSYIAFSQFLLYWYGNIPEETAWFRVRISDGWQYLSYGLIIVHFAIPFLGLLSRHVRRHRSGLFFFACWALVVHWLDMTFLVMPNAGPFSMIMMFGHMLGGIGMFSLFIGFLLLRASDAPLVATGDPRLHEALSYANPLL
ncbi:MAG: quinol:cytochrome C oxidoreductase [Planctomycetota bacterium]|jgi:hypothetical protein|nr:quinol:cytochrome C oxidoreductase [Planctomycetota bacterium]